MSHVVHKPAQVWVLPVGAELLAIDGRQAWYATDGGTGTVVDLPVVAVELDYRVEEG